MKRVLYLLFSLLFLYSFNTVSAEESWDIKNFHSDISILQDGTVSVTENITADFGTVEKHGIFRDIPVVYLKDDGDEYYTKIELQNIIQDGNQAKYEVNKNGNYIQFKIGDPDKTISGRHTYAITYLATGILRSFEDHDELYWNVTGNDWQVSIEKASTKIVLLKNGLLKNTCYEGAFGIQGGDCTNQKISEREVLITSSRMYNPGEGLTAVVGYTKGMVPILVVEKPDPVKDFLNAVFSPLGIAGFIIPLFLVSWFIGGKWYKSGRDLWFKARFPNDPSAREEIRPIGARETLVVEFEPPEKLRPAEIGVLIDERADTLDVTSTIIDLASRGFLTIKEEPKKWLFGSTDYVLTKLEKSEKDLLNYEKELLKRLFETGIEVKISSLKTKFYDDLKKVKEKLYADIADKKLFIGNPESIRGKYLALGIVILVLGFVLLFFMSGITFYVIPFASSTVFAGLITIIFSQIMPRRSAKGYELYQRAKGYREFLSRAEKYRAQFFEKKNMFPEILPYTIVFGVTEKFANAFKELGIEPPRPTWYVGTGHFSPTHFGTQMNAFSSSLSNAIASAPKSSGGFSSGGSSGGGFGGGGGGSW